MQDPSTDFARRAAAVLTRSSAHDETPSQESRGRAIAAMEAALREKRRQARRRWLVLGAAVVAAAAGGALILGRRRSVDEGSPAVTVVAHPLASGVVVLSPTATRALQAPQTLPRGARVVARESGRATLELSTGTRLALEADADVTMEDDGATERFFLAAGRIRADVAPLRPAQRFVVATPDAEVEVHGTSFRVAVVAADAACENGLRTRVEVLEGVVAVRARGQVSALHPGDHWPPSCDAAPAESAVALERPAAHRASAPKVTLSLALPPTPEATGTSSAPLASARASSLSAQNDLFARAVSARNGRRLAEAVALFDELLAKYPRGPLGESASVERMKTLALEDPRRGAVAARRYLEAYPDGFARTEARKLSEALP